MRLRLSFQHAPQDCVAALGAFVTLIGIGLIRRQPIFLFSAQDFVYRSAEGFAMVLSLETEGARLQATPLPSPGFQHGDPFTGPFGADPSRFHWRARLGAGVWISDPGPVGSIPTASNLQVNSIVTNLVNIATADILYTCLINTFAF